MQSLCVCHGTGCPDGPQVAQRLRAELDLAGLGEKVKLTPTGCPGLCEKGPIIIVQPEGILYTSVKVEDAADIVRSLADGRVVDRLLYKDPVTGEVALRYSDAGFYKQQVRNVLRYCGQIGPENIEDYLAVGGYEGLRKALIQMTPEQVIDEVKRSGLRGRGGAGFPTGLKWQFCRQAPGDQKYMICNGDEGDPGAFMDRSLLEANPHAVIEGILIAAYAIGASEGYFYIRAEYPLAIRNIRTALGQAEERGLLGQRVLDTDFCFQAHIKEGAGAFVCGEETALLASIEGKRGMPRPRPPFPAQKGLWGKPTTINNVETLANVPLIISQGAEWFAQFGTERSKGTKVFALTGKVRNTGLVEVPMGMTLREIIFDVGGGILGNRRFKAAQTGGPSGGSLPAKLLDLPVDYESLTQAGSIMGSGGLVVMDETTCMVDLARFFLSFTQSESCGKCVPCRLGTKHMLDMLQSICDGKGKESDLALLEELARMVNAGSLCGLGQTAPNPVLTSLRYFRHEYESHIREKRCLAAVCQNLVDSPCQHMCPAGVDVPQQLRLLLEEEPAKALAVVRERNPFPAVIGRVCTHPCERLCRRGQLDAPVSIRAVRRYIADLVESDPDWREPLPETRHHENVAVIGAGPAGLSAAYYLARLGYPVTVFEALPVAGGMMAVGIPDYRLSKDVLNREIEAIRRMGVEIRTNTALGRDITLGDLRAQGYQAFFVAIGAHGSMELRVTGEDLAGVVPAVDFLRQVNLGHPVAVGRRVAVIGGGNVAMDAARSALRLGADEVHIIYRRQREEMPALDEEIEQAEEEGVHFTYLAAPIRVLGDGVVRGLECQRMELGSYDESGRRRPVPVPGSDFRVDVDTVIPAIGQAVQLPRGSLDGLDVAPGRTIDADPLTTATSLQGVFAGGDAVTGPATVIEAIAAGLRAATSIDRYLRGEPLEPVLLHQKKPWKKELKWEIPEEAAAIERKELPQVAADERKDSFAEVELGFDRATALRQAQRCLHCDLEEE